MVDKQKFPSEMIDLPSGGSVYSADSPLRKGKIEVKYMTAKEEDILTSQNLIKKGIVLDKLLDSLILTEGVKSKHLILGDKNAILVAARILAYGAEYEVEVTDPNTDEKLKHVFDLSDCPFKELPEDVDYSENNFEFELPISKNKVTFQLLTGVEESKIDKELTAVKKLGSSAEITTRLRHVITSVNDETDKSTISEFVNTLLSRDSLALRQEILRVAPDVELNQEIDLGGELVTVDIPLTTEFFWPTS